MFKHPYEIRDFTKLTDSIHGNIIKMLTGKMRKYKPAGYDWKFLHDCDKQVQDIVHAQYESLGTYRKEVRMITA